MNFRADLHCHSNCSDGTMSPIEIIDMAKQEGLLGISITDHDTIKAYDKSFLAYAQRKNIPVISGVEFSSVHNGISVHVLGYAFSINDEIREFCYKHALRRKERMNKILSLLYSNNIKILEKDVLAFANNKGDFVPIGRPHIAMALIAKKYVKTLNEAFDKFLGKGQKCYCPTIPFNVEETVEIIHRAKGKAVIAHPHLIQEKHIVNDLLEISFDGIEAYYCKIPNKQEQYWIEEAMKRRLFITGGSDFHGDIKPNTPIGCSWTNESTFQQLYTHYLAVNR